MFSALICFSEEVRSRCHVKHTLPRWPADSGGVGDGSGAGDPSAANAAGASQSGAGGQNVRRQKSWDMLDQSAIQYARQSHKVQPHQVGLGGNKAFIWVAKRMDIFHFKVRGIDAGLSDSTLPFCPS